MQGMLSEDMQSLAGHADSRITCRYDQRQKQVTRNRVTDGFDDHQVLHDVFLTYCCDV
jgi:hypothetical protein